MKRQGDLLFIPSNAVTGKQLGRPQKLTALNAIASTFGLRGEEYRPEMET